MTQPGGFEAEALRMRTMGRVIGGHVPSIVPLPTLAWER